MCCHSFACLLIGLEVTRAVALRLLLSRCYMLVRLVHLDLVDRRGGLMMLLDLLRIVVATTSRVGAYCCHILLTCRLVFYLSTLASDHTSTVGPILLTNDIIATWRALICTLTCILIWSVATSYFEAGYRAASAGLTCKRRRLRYGALKARLGLCLHITTLDLDTMVRGVCMGRGASCL